MKTEQDSNTQEVRDKFETYLPAHVRAVRELGLSCLDRDIRETIFHLTKNNGNGCFFTNETWERLLGVSGRSVRTSIAKLEKLGLIKVHRNSKTSRRVCFTNQIPVVSSKPLEFDENGDWIGGGEVDFHREAEAELPEGGSFDVRQAEAELPHKYQQGITKEEEPKKDARASARLSSKAEKIEELSDYATEQIFGTASLFDHPPEWLGLVLGWIKDRIDPRRVDYDQPKKPRRIVSERQINRLTSKVRAWLKLIDEKKEMATEYGEAIRESVEQASTEGWSDLFPEKLFKEAEFKARAAVREGSDTEIDAVIAAAGYQSAKVGFGARKVIAEKIKGEKMDDVKKEVRQLRNLRRRGALAGRRVGAQTFFTLLFCGQPEQLDALLMPEQIREEKEKPGFVYS